MDLEEMKKDSYKVVSDFFIKSAFRAIYTEQMSKKEIRESFLKGIRYSERANNGGTKLVKLPRKILPYYRN